MISLSSRKRREVRTVALSRSRTGFGFTITGELPCRLGGVVPGSVADCAGLQSGDQLIGINGHDVSMLSHDEVVRRIGSCRSVLRLNVAEHSSEDSSADSSDNAETNSGRMVNNVLHRQPVSVSSVQHQPTENLVWEARHNGFSNRSKYGQHVRSGHAGRYHTHSAGLPAADRYSGSRNSHDYLDLQHRNELRHGIAQRRKTKHTVITREARIGIQLPERQPYFSDRYLPVHNTSDDSADDDDDISLSGSELQVVVGYSGSVEMPSNAPRLAGSRLQSIRGAVNRLRATNRARCLVVMDISADGIRLTDAMCRVVACYVTSRIAFCGICPDDRRFFGIVMTSGESRAAHGEKAANTSCHVFMVDPELVEHHLHAGIAARFGLNCTMDLDTPRCLEFPVSAVPIISFLGRLYRHRKNNTSFVPLPGNFCSTNARGICEGKAQDDRVYVVDVLKNGSDEHSHTDAVMLAADEENERFIHNLSVIEPVVSDGNLLNGNELSQGKKLGEQKCLVRGRMVTRSWSQASNILRESNGYIPSSGLRRVTTTLDDSSFRHGHHDMPSCAIRTQPLRHHAADIDDSDTDSTSSALGNGRHYSASPVPPPVPPKPSISNRAANSNSRFATNKPATSSVSSGVGMTPSRTPNGSGRPVPVPQSCSASKPPLPERRPTLTRQAYKSTAGNPAQDVPGRPKSTPPVNRITLTAPVIYDSDPGERPNEKTCKPDDGFFQSPEDLCVDMLAASCKQLTSVGEQNIVGRVAGWAVHFDRLLADSAGRATFAEFLRTEFSEENLLFWIKCEEYRKLTDAKQRKVAAADLIAGHFADGACDPVNVEGTVRQAVMDNVTSAAVDLFDAAQKQIYLLMKHDSFARFLKSDVYKEALIGEMEGRPLTYISLPASHSKLKAAGRKKMKKSRSAAAASDEKRRKTLLPWTRNKIEKKSVPTSVNDDLQTAPSGVGSQSENSSLSETVDSESADQMCHFVLPDGSEAWLPATAGHTVGTVIDRVASRLQRGLEFIDAIVAGTNDRVSFDDDAVQFASKTLHLLQCGVFRLDVPGRRVMAVRARVSQTLRDVLSPILTRIDISWSDVIVHIAGTGVILAEDTTVAAVECKHVIIQSLDEVKGKKRKDGMLSSGKLSVSKQKSPVLMTSSMTMGQLLKLLFAGVADGRLNFDNVVYNDVGVWTPDWPDGMKQRVEEGRHTGLFSFIRRNSLGDKKSLPNAASNVPPTTAPSYPAADNRQNNDEHRMLDLLKRVQNRQYDDQRGTSLTAFKEMPDFLRESNVEQLIVDEEFSEKCALDESRTEVCRYQDTDVDSGLQLSPAQCWQQNEAFSDEDDVPSHEDAERYFSCGSQAVLSPDYSDPRLMERSVRDIGMESPTRNAHSWTLVGNVADNPRVSSTKKTDNFVFAVPSMPPLRIYRRRESMPLLETDGRAAARNRSSPQSADPRHQPLSVDASVGQNELSSTPSPTTHDLVLVGGDCVIKESNDCRVEENTLAPIVDPEDSGEEFGIV